MWMWHNLRRFTPFLCVVYIAQTLVLLGALGLMASTFVVLRSSFSTLSQLTSYGSYFIRSTFVAFNLILLSGACAYVLRAYTLRFRQPGRRTFPLSSRQAQLRALALLSALPLCGLTLALILPPVFPVFYVTYGVIGLATGVLVVALVRTSIREAVVD